MALKDLLFKPARAGTASGPGLDMPASACMGKQKEKVSKGGWDKAEEEKARLAAAVESTDEVIMIISRQGEIEYVNPAFERTTGYCKEEVLGRSPVALGSKRHDRTLYAGFLDTVTAGKTWAGRMTNRKKDGELVHFEGTISPVRDREGRVSCYVSVFQDVTERMRLESIAEAASATNSLGYALSGLRHELVNPLNSIKLSVAVLGAKLDPSMKTYIERIHEEVSRMEYLLNSLRSFNRYEALEIRELELSVFLAEFVSLVKCDFADKGIIIGLDAASPASAMCDPRALKQVLLNLIANSVDALAGTRGGEILLGLFNLGRTLMVRVADNGAGIEKEQMKNLFKPFNTSKKQGTGLGLVIVKKMITGMGGEVKIASTRGCGTTVDLLLPSARG